MVVASPSPAPANAVGAESPTAASEPTSASISRPRIARFVRGDSASLLTTSTLYRRSWDLSRASRRRFHPTTPGLPLGHRHLAGVEDPGGIERMLDRTHHLDACRSVLGEQEARLPVAD